MLFLFHEGITSPNYETFDFRAIKEFPNPKFVSPKVEAPHDDDAVSLNLLALSSVSNCNFLTANFHLIDDPYDLLASMLIEYQKEILMAISNHLV